MNKGVLWLPRTKSSILVSFPSKLGFREVKEIFQPSEETKHKVKPTSKSVVYANG